LTFVLAHDKDQSMKRNRFSEEQIIGILKEHEAGVSVADLCRKHGVSDASIYKWKAKYSGMDWLLNVRQCNWQRSQFSSGRVTPPSHADRRCDLLVFFAARFAGFLPSIDMTISLWPADALRGFFGIRRIHSLMLRFSASPSDRRRFHRAVAACETERQSACSRFVPHRGT
jgi:hypothetical protein